MTQLLEKDNSQCHALVRDDKVLGDYIIFEIVLLRLFKNWPIIAAFLSFIFYFLLCLMMSKVEDLSRMSGLLFYLSKNKERFRLLFRIPRGIEPVSSLFKQVSSLQLMLYSFVFNLKGILSMAHLPSFSLKLFFPRFCNVVRHC